MELKKAKSLAEDIIDICNQLGDETLSEACSGIYNDISAAKSTELIISSVRELMVFINEAPWEDYDLLDLKDEAEELSIKLFEEFEEF
jgi:hypothetical protein